MSLVTLRTQSHMDRSPESFIFRGMAPFHSFPWNFEQNKGLSLTEIKTGVLLALSSISGLTRVRWRHSLSVLDEGEKYLLPWVL